MTIAIFIVVWLSAVPVIIAFWEASSEAPSDENPFRNEISPAVTATGDELKH